MDEDLARGLQTANGVVNYAHLIRKEYVIIFTTWDSE
jgi:hypothetical protein